ncbi:MAG: phenylalanine 4-monooxygenase [Sphingomonas bacterium]|nr:phenylalanine 4-monooxygenase [Sphingomonas bacterium]
MIEQALRKSSASDRWQDYVIAQRWDAFSAEDHAVWDILFERQVDARGTRIVAPFLDGLDLLHLSKPGIPDLAELNTKLLPKTGWRTVAVPGLVPDHIFFAMLSERVFPIGNFIRTRAQLDYLDEPDCFHDIFGHVPMLSDPEQARLMEHVGKLGLAAIARGHGEIVARIYWYSVEFGLSREDGQVKIYGAGLASSFGEFGVSLDDEAVERRRFSIAEAASTPYENDHMQPLYFISDGASEVAAQICAIDAAARDALAAPPR